MSFGEPRAIEGQCNARLTIGDNYGDNHATMLCQLGPAHEGVHQESYHSGSSGKVTITWEKDDPEHGEIICSDPECSHCKDPEEDSDAC